ncbi:MAG: imidazole glycerol phosphate synthase subunit HisH [Thermoflexales bacterium]|nr:imidazole glycerol phosphate synthase subunit HisH [Thermoflexales bacterium]
MILIVDYKAGNLTSVKRALDHLEIPCKITADGQELRQAERIIFPGVGHAATAMAALQERGLDTALRDAFRLGTPIMGICLGCQIVLTHSEEGDTVCLGLVEGVCRRFQLENPMLKIPHMGWNAIQVVREHPIMADLAAGDEFYFVHSYYPQPAAAEHVLATCEYELSFPAAIGYKNLFATQFHPEKSGRLGLRMLRNFSQWDGDVC